MILITQPRSGFRHHEIYAVEKAAQSLNWTVFQAPQGWRLTEELIASKQEGVPYGTQTFCEVIAQQMGWKFKQNPLDWLTKLPQEYLKRNIEFMSLSEAKNLTETKFIKPADDKLFDAKVYEPGTLITHAVVPDNTPCLVSDPVTFDLEYRFFVDGSHVKTWSNYVFFDQIANLNYYDMIPVKEAVFPSSFIAMLLGDLKSKGIETAPSVIDIGRIPNKGWAVIESNPSFCSGIYGCEPLQVLKVLQMSCYVSN